MPKYRGNLSAAIFPLARAKVGRTVIIPQIDNTYDRRVDPEGEQKNAGIPQAMHLTNILPTANGYQSIGFKPEIVLSPVGVPGSAMLVGIRVAHDPLLGAIPFYFFEDIGVGGTKFCAAGLNLQVLGGFDTICGGSLDLANGDISFASVRGTLYVYLRGSSNIYKVNLTGTGPDNISSVTFTLEANLPDIRYITSSYNYLIAIDLTGEVKWSSTTNPLDLTPSLVTGAGNIRPIGTSGKITGLYAHPSGFIIETTEDSYYADYTNNARYPFRFRRIKNAVPGIKLHVTESSEEYFGMGGPNLYRIIEDTAQLIAGEISTWISSGSLIDLFDPVTYTFSIDTRVSQVNNILQFHANRYLLCCYRRNTASSYAGAIIYDVLLKRYGRIVMDFDYVYSLGGRLFFDGTEIDFLRTTVHSSILVLGKFQLLRDRRITLHKLAIEGDFIEVYTRVLTSLHGQDFSAVGVPTLYHGEAFLRAYNCRLEGQNFALVVQGNFELSTVELDFQPGGIR